MPRGGLRPNAGRPPGAKNKAKVSITRRQLDAYKRLDTLERLNLLSEKHFERGEFEAAARVEARKLPYTIGRVEKIRGEPKRSPAQQFELDFPRPAIAQPGDAAPPDTCAALLPN